MKLKNIAAALGVAGGLLLAGQAQAFLIDDFNQDNLATQVRSDPPAVGDLPTTLTSIDTTNTVWNALGGGAGISRNMDATLVSGDSVQIEICSVCDAGHVIADAGVTPSVGTYFYEWMGPAVDLSSENTFEFDWGADLGGSTWSVSINGGAAIAGGSLPATPGPGSLTHRASVGLTGDLSAVTSIRLDIAGVGALDGNIDNVQAVPAPGVLALLSIGLLGLGWQRRRAA